MNRRSKPKAFLLALALGGSCFACRQTTVLAPDSEIPTATVKEADLQLKVFTTGVLRTPQSRAITAPPIPQATSPLATLPPSAAPVHTPHALRPFTPTHTQYTL